MEVSPPIVSQLEHACAVLRSSQNEAELGQAAVGAVTEFYGRGLQPRSPHPGVVELLLTVQLVDGVRLVALPCRATPASPSQLVPTSP